MNRHRNRNNAIAAAAYELVHVALNPQVRNRPLGDHVKSALDRLPKLNKEDVDLEESCPICLTTFAAVFAEDWIAGARDRSETLDNGRGLGEDIGGVTKLVECGHLFCRKDLTEWIRNEHGNCPTCRHTFLEINPAADSDEESSDGGEYVPDDFDEEDDVIDVDGNEADGPSVNAAVDEEEGLPAGGPANCLDIGEDDTQNFFMDEDEYDETDADRSSVWGLTDADSSEAGDMSIDDEDGITADVLERDVSISVHEDEDPDGEDGTALNVSRQEETKNPGPSDT